MDSRERDLHSRLAICLRQSAGVMAVLNAARACALPDWRLFSGAVYQTLWNSQTGRPADYGILDYDIGYFDRDTSESTESVWSRRLAALLPEAFRDKVEAANQARVHLWFEAQFGRPYPPLANTDEALTRSLATAHAIGVRLEPDDSISIAAPFGLEDAFGMILRPTADVLAGEAFRAKAKDVTLRWPEVKVL
jgi:uncharacterized protein